MALHAGARRRAPRAWAPADTAAIHPGVQMYTEGAQCTAQLRLHRRRRQRLRRLRRALRRHRAATDTNGCDVDSLPLGTPVTFQGGSPGQRRAQVGAAPSPTPPGSPCSGRRDRREHLRLQRPRAGEGRRRDVSKVNPSIPFWGGPIGINTDGTAAGDRVYTYGNSSLRGGIERSRPNTGISLGDDAADGGWTHPVYTVTPASPVTPARRSSTPTARPSAPCPPSASPRCRLEQRRRPRQRARLRPAALRHRRPAAGPRHRAVLAHPLSRRP